MKHAVKLMVAYILVAGSPCLMGASSGDLPEAPADTEITTLAGVETESDTGMSVITAKLNLKPKWRKLDTEDHGSFVQVILPGTVIPKPGTFYDGAGPVIKKVAVFQVTPSDGAIRFFTSGEAAKVKVATTAEVLGDRVIITVDHKKITDFPPATREKIAANDPVAQKSAFDPDMLPAFDKIKVPTADHVVANTPVRTDIPAPALQVKETSEANAEPAAAVVSTSAANQAASVNMPDFVLPAAATGEKAAAEPKLAVGSNVPDLGGKLSGIAVFSGVMLILMGVLYFMKPLLRRRSLNAADGEMIKMKTIATMPLAAKQRLALVQVGGQQILLAISPDNVNYITTIATFNTAGPTVPSAQVPRAALPKAVQHEQLSRDQFSVQLLNAENDGAVEMRRAQATQKRTLPLSSAAATGKAVGKSSTTSQTKAELPQKQPARKSINIAIGDDGIKRRKDPGDASSEKPLEDITRLIREKLKNLPAI